MCPDVRQILQKLEGILPVNLNLLTLILKTISHSANHYAVFLENDNSIKNAQLTFFKNGD